MDLTKQKLSPEEIKNLTFAPGLGGILGLLGITEEDYNQGLTDPNMSLRKLIESGEVYSDPRQLDQLAGEDRIRNAFGQQLQGILPYKTTLDDAAKMMGMHFSYGGTAAKTYPKSLQEALEQGVAAIEQENPLYKVVHEDTTMRFMDPASHRSMMTANPLADIIKSFPRESFKDKSVDEIAKQIKTMLLHEHTHFLMADDGVYQYAKDIYVNAPKDVKMIMKDSIQPEQILKLVEKLPKETAQRGLNRWYVSEFAAYSKEALEAAAGGIAMSKVGRNLGELAKKDPQVMEMLNKASNIPPELTKDIVASLKAKRGLGKSQILLDTLGYTDDEILTSIKKEQEKVISSKSGGVTKPITAKAREVVPIGKPMWSSPEAAREPVRSMGTKEYIPTEPSTTRSIEGLGFDPVRTYNMEEADKLTRNLTGDAKWKAWKKIMDILGREQKGKPSKP